MEVFSRCNDEWITAGMDGIRIALSGPSIETAMNILGILDQPERMNIFDKIKIISRVIVKELIQERIKSQRESNANR